MRINCSQFNIKSHNPIPSYWHVWWFRSTAWHHAVTVNLGNHFLWFFQGSYTSKYKANHFIEDLPLTTTADFSPLCGFTFSGWWFDHSPDFRSIEVHRKGRHPGSWWWQTRSPGTRRVSGSPRKRARGLAETDKSSAEQCHRVRSCLPTVVVKGENPSN